VLDSQRTASGRSLRKVRHHVYATNAHSCCCLVAPLANNMQAVIPYLCSSSACNPQCAIQLTS
jgi:hypothetical protein